MPRISSRSTPCLVSLVLLTLLVARPTVAQAQAAQPPLRVAVVGLVHGHIEGFLSALPNRKNIELVAIVEPDPALAAKFEKKYNLPHSLFFASLETMMAERRPEALLLYNAIGDHRKVIEEAAHYLVPIMVEKPLTISLDDALAIRTGKTVRLKKLEE